MFVPLQTKWKYNDDVDDTVLERWPFFDLPDEDDPTGEPAPLAFATWRDAYRFADENVGGSVGNEIELYAVPDDIDVNEVDPAPEQLVGKVTGGTWSIGPAGQAGIGAFAVEPA